MIAVGLPIPTLPPLASVELQLSVDEARQMRDVFNQGYHEAGAQLRPFGGVSRAQLGLWANTIDAVLKERSS